MKRFLCSFNWLLLVAMLSLIAIGAVSIWSAGSARNVKVLQNAWISHISVAIITLIPYFILSTIDYRKTLSWTAKPFYVLSIILLIAVLAFGAEIYGGRRWLWFFQPSEVAKPATIFLLATWLGEPDTNRTKFRHLLIGFGLLAIPSFLILKEPDLGTALVLVPTVLVMLLAARVCRKVLIPMLLIGLLTGCIVLGSVWAAEHVTSMETRERIYQVLPLRPHQIKRLKTFVAPDSDPYGGGWTLRQAKISIGSGSLTGKGIGRGEQKFLGYLPPSISMNDFIFAVLAEETGFVGSVITLVLFMVLIFTTLWIAFRADDDRGRLIAVGTAVLIFTHVYVNIAMSLGLMPITGLPLPFISSGKTFLVVLMVLFGIIQSVSTHKGIAYAG